MPIATRKELLEILDRANSADNDRLRNDLIDEEVWDYVLSAEVEIRRNVVLINKHMPAHVLAKFAKDTDSSVRCSIAMKNRIDPEILRVLASDTDESVRARVAYNKNLPTEMLMRLCEDPSELVRRAATEVVSRRKS